MTNSGGGTWRRHDGARDGDTAAHRLGGARLPRLKENMVQGYSTDLRYTTTGMNAYRTNATFRKHYWEHADPTYSHIAYNRWLRSEAQLQDYWRASWLHRLPARPGRVAEYGIGAGLLGKLLLTNGSATHYTGFDIAQRQLDAARKTLQACCAGRYELRLVDGELRASQLRGVDSFISQAVIQHFPSDAYTARFLDAIAEANVPWLMLQVRDNIYARGQSVTHAQSTSRATLRRHLPRYNITWVSPRASNGYIFYVFEARERRPLDLESAGDADAGFGSASASGDRQRGARGHRLQAPAHGSRSSAHPAVMR